MENLQIIKSENFGNVQCDFYGNNKEIFVTREQIGQALRYDSPRTAITKIHNRHKERLDKYSVVTKLVSTDGKSYDTYLYNAKGIMEICRWSQQKKADEFMDWTWEVMDSLRKGETTNIAIDHLKEIEAQAKRDRATAMLLNAQNRMIKPLLSNTEGKNLSQIAIDVMGIKAVEQITGKNMNQYLPECEKLYSATEVGAMLGVSAMKVGKTANKYGLKVDKYGKTVMSKSQHSSKEVPQFLYNDKGVQILSGILGVAVKTA